MESEENPRVFFCIISPQNHLQRGSGGRGEEKEGRTPPGSCLPLNHTPWLVIINIRKSLDFVWLFRYHCMSLSKDCDEMRVKEVIEFRLKYMRVYKDGNTIVVRLS